MFKKVTHKDSKFIKNYEIFDTRINSLVNEN